MEYKELKNTGIIVDHTDKGRVYSVDIGTMPISVAKKKLKQLAKEIQNG